MKTEPFKADLCCLPRRGYRMLAAKPKPNKNMRLLRECRRRGISFYDYADAVTLYHDFMFCGFYIYREKIVMHYVSRFARPLKERELTEIVK